MGQKQIGGPVAPTSPSEHQRSREMIPMEIVPVNHGSFMFVPLLLQVFFVCLFVRLSFFRGWTMFLYFYGTSFRFGLRADSTLQVAGACRRSSARTRGRWKRPFGSRVPEVRPELRPYLLDSYWGRYWGVYLLRSK